eukprot:402731-Prorocentrum_minimum.AAC.1
MSTRRNVYELSKVQLMGITPNHQPYVLEEFSEHQITQRTHKAVPALEAVVERMQVGANALEPPIQPLWSP